MVQKSYTFLIWRKIRVKTPKIFCCGSNTGWEDEVTEKFLFSSRCLLSFRSRCELSTLSIGSWMNDAATIREGLQMNRDQFRQNRTMSREIPDFFAAPGCRWLQLSMRVALFTMCCTWDSSGAEKSVSFGHWWSIGEVLVKYWCHVPVTSHMVHREKRCMDHRIGWWENFNRKPLYLMVILPWFPVNFPLNQSNEYNEWSSMVYLLPVASCCHVPAPKVQQKCHKDMHPLEDVLDCLTMFLLSKVFDVWINFGINFGIISQVHLQPTSPISTVTFLDRFHLKTSTHPAPCVGGVPRMSFPLAPRLRRRLTDFEVTKEASKRWGWSWSTNSVLIVRKWIIIVMKWNESIWIIVIYNVS